MLRKYRIYKHSGKSEILDFSQVPALTVYADYFDLYVGLWGIFLKQPHVSNLLHTPRGIVARL